MLKHLSIKNYALIDHLELDFHDGFSVITGETGAGKSIMLSALSLILGKRADVKAIKSQDLKCIVEGSFALSKAYQPYFESKDLDYESISILRREISPSGKSRAFINDTPVTLDVLSELAERLIDVHSQHQNLLLNNTSFQLQLIDDFAQNEEILNSYKSVFQNYKELDKKRESLLQIAQNESGDSDYLQFLFEELQSSNLKTGEQEEIEKELQLAENATEIQSDLSQSVHVIEEKDDSILSQFAELEVLLSNLERFDNSMGELKNRVGSSRIELDDILAELRQKLDNTEFEPGKAEELDERLSLLISLQRKHQAASMEELIEKRDSLDQRIQELTGLEDNIRQLEEKIAACKMELETEAEKLHNSRKKLIPNLEKQIHQLLDSLNFSQARFIIDIEKTASFTEKGNDSINFLFNANPGQPAGKLSKLASGGELSRVMLALKAIMATTQNLPSIIFDEIDTGVSGETAGKIGDILKGMGNSMQVIAISHLPQIASMGQHHYKVEKRLENNQNRTSIYPLNEDDRINELARLLSGERISEAALKNAKELLQNA